MVGFLLGYWCGGRLCAGSLLAQGLVLDERLREAG